MRSSPRPAQPPPRRWGLPLAVREHFAGHLMSGEDEGLVQCWLDAESIDPPTLELMRAVVSQLDQRGAPSADWYDRDRLLWVTVAYTTDQPGRWGCEVFLSFTDNDNNTQEKP